MEPKVFEVEISRNEIRVTTWIENNSYCGIARCHPEDRFDFMTGFELAYKRMIEAIDNDTYFTGKIVYIGESNIGYKKGKIYNVNNGMISGHLIPRLKKNDMDKYNFVVIVED